MKPFRTAYLSAAVIVSAGWLHAQSRPAARGELPPGPGQDLVRRVCGSTCHGADMVAGRGRSRDQWTQVVNNMIARGAKASEPEFVQVVDYLAKNFGPNYTPPAPPVEPVPAAGRGPRAPRNEPKVGPGPLGGGPADAHIVDEAAANRGKTVYIAQCITCHGNKARGANANVPASQQGSDLVRSLVVLKDRYGDRLGEFLKKGHPMQSGRASSSLPENEVADLSHFLHQKVMETLRGGPYSDVINVLTGDPKAGAAYFSGAGKCNTCHSVTGDLAGIGKRYDPPTLQARFLFPRTLGFGVRGGARQSKPVTVTVTPAGGAPIQGVLERLDDFNVALRDSEGEYRSFQRGPSLKVEKHDPYQMHNDLLDQYTDKNIHDIVAYLETLK